MKQIKSGESSEGIEFIDTTVKPIADQWINAQHRLPPIGTGGVLAVLETTSKTEKERFQMVVNYDEDGWICPYRKDQIKITHWQHLPALPINY